MIWLAWRQFRVQAYVAVGLLAVMAVALLMTGPHLAHVYDTVILHCQAHGDCESVKQSFLTRDRLLRHLTVVTLVVPALVGMFWAAPLVAREMESGTFRLAWTQSVTRSRWIATKLAVIGLASVAVTGLFSFMVTWWTSPFDAIKDFPFSNFELRDIAPMGYAAFAFALGVAAGAVIRRTLPAMAATLVAFAGVRVAFTQWVRPRFASPLHYAGRLSLFSFGGSTAIPGKGQEGDWVISETTYNARGNVIGHGGGIGPDGGVLFRPVANGSDRMVFQGLGECPNKFPVLHGGGNSSHQVNNVMQEAISKCVASFHLRDTLTYQPTSRYWTFQWYEMTIYIVFALLLAGFSWWWVRRRLS